MSADQIVQNEYQAQQIDELRLKPVKTRSCVKKENKQKTDGVQIKKLSEH